MTTYPSRAACQAARISYRCLDYWTKTNLVTPTTPATGSGTRRQYSVKDVVLLAVVKRLTDMGLGLDAIRPVVEWVGVWAALGVDILDDVVICDGIAAWTEGGLVGDVGAATYRIDIRGVAGDVRRRLQLSDDPETGEVA